MRILFASYAEKTHFLGMVPLAWALQTAGHEVRVASQPELTDVITGAGLTAVPVGRNHNLHLVLRQSTALSRNLAAPGTGVSTDEDADFDFAENRPEVLTFEYVRDGYRHAVPWWFRLVNRSMVEELTGYCRQWRPDLVIWEPVTFAGPIAATAIGVPHARLMWSVDLFARMRGHLHRLNAGQAAADREDLLADWLSEQVGRHGGQFSEVMTTGHFTIDTTPDSLRHDPHLNLDLDLHYLPMRHIPYNGPSTIPTWLRTPPTKPRIAITLGVSSTERLDGYAISVQEILDHLHDLDLDIIATLPPTQADQLRIPTNTHVVPFAPLNALAPTCNAVIHHGGNGTYQTTLTSGVPQLTFPRFFDGAIRADHVERQGAGITITNDAATGPRIRQAVQRLLGEPAFAHNAARLAAEMHALPTPNDLVPQIEELTAKYGSGAT
ncbi:activator-dependent family glycosyltransferase [Solwaraspora sp. WMMD1047]|uniref:activator-dependent family glycosyltransferase n=1 Tax=Solwaraspora sp. WMMD1047 TaxID=3016102 RepID=UPI0024159AB4|nr:activator-dependent family glycosyltransferase [Solwaraspora sp. WMMD1047]MDG4827783.1 activator-dependent family glycosyltransferase [Solwaraspora sp. WMMD1047]